LGEFGVEWVEGRVGCSGDAGQALKKGVSGSVEELIWDAEDSTLPHGFEGVPVALLDHALKGNAIPCSAPGEEKNIRIGSGDCFCGGVSSWDTQILASGGFDKFGDPGLGVDERFAPLFAVDDRGVGARSAALAGGCDGGLHVGDERFGFALCADNRGNQADVLVDVGK